MFDGCSKLTSLPDISKWNMWKMFYACVSLISLPDISIWDYSKVTDVNQMFDLCKSLWSFPDISKWNIPNKDMDQMDYLVI